MTINLRQIMIVIRGAGEMASATAWRLHQAQLNVLMTEREAPIAVRRRVSFCEAVYNGRVTVEGVTAHLVDDPSQVSDTHEAGEIPLLIDPNLNCLKTLKPDVLVEATLSKRNFGINTNLAPLVIALGPGFIAGTDAHMVIETNRGHNLGRIITDGSAEPNTGIPGNIGGYTAERVLRAPDRGTFVSVLDLGAKVTAGQIVGTVGDSPVKSQVDGIVRGLIRSGCTVAKGLKLGDVDPRGDLSYLNTISDKARAVAGAVLEGIMRVYNQ